MEKIRVRFHLKSGKNFGKWQVKLANGNKDYYCPTEYNFELFEAKLYNRPNEAQKILDGAHKSVCAWIECESMIIYRNNQSDMLSRLPTHFTKISYNPRCSKHWNIPTQANVDGYIFETIYTEGKNLYFVNC